MNPIAPIAPIVIDACIIATGAHGVVIRGRQLQWADPPSGVNQLKGELQTVIELRLSPAAAQELLNGLLQTLPNAVTQSQSSVKMLPLDPLNVN
jgi:hypothetical protein